MNLLIDLGNTRLKWAQQSSGDWRTDALLAADRDIVPALDKAWSAISSPAQIVVSSVSSPEKLETLTQYLRQRWSLTPHVLRAQAQQLGVQNRYTAPATLGADRWAALIAARGLSSAPTCIVDAGTAVTVDALSADGVFLGGAIIPGLRLWRQSLIQGTHGLKAQDGDDSNSLARSTANGIASGTLLGLAGAVERLIQEHRKTLGEKMQIILTGGDAAQLAPQLPWPVTQIPDLVLKGLARIAETL